MIVEGEQAAPFYIEGPDEDGCVWICSAQAGEWCHNMGPADQVVEVLSQWLWSLDKSERDYRYTQDE